MIYPQTILDVVDNSGVNKVKCIQVKKKAYKHNGISGSLFVGVVISTKKVKKKLLYKPGDIVLGFVIRTKKFKSNTQIMTYFIQNAAILVENKIKSNCVPLSTRVHGPAPFFIKQKGYVKVNALIKKFI